MKFTVLVLSITFLFFGCSPQPDKATLDNCIYKEMLKHTADNNKRSGLNLFKFEKVDDYYFTNQYTIKKDGETFRYYEYDCTVSYEKTWSGKTKKMKGDVTGKFSLVKRGNSWFYQD